MCVETSNSAALYTCAKLKERDQQTTDLLIRDYQFTSRLCGAEIFPDVCVGVCLVHFMNRV